ncbi:DUF302 domain-containing protein [Roseibium aestuarii]|uniref:DUF302 domain-containing protein n=1 Tax=Roseibium aestuarii TaxID=2600299 RepID=A0ABW4K0E8_9HYPH|nr:DUF302 domain-containing protein [Roseibium aestuarii]
MPAHRTIALPAQDPALLRLALLVTLALLCVQLLALRPLQASELGPRAGWQVVRSEDPFEVLSHRVKEAIKAERMGLVTRASASDGARGAGVTIPGNEVLGVFRNDYARRMLDASLSAGIEAPIRLYLMENDDGSSTLAYKMPSHVFSPYLEEGGEPLKDLAAELDMIFAAIAARATGPLP